MKWLKKIEVTDVFQLTGLTLLGVGLFFCAGLGIALSVVGAILVIMGFFGGSMTSRDAKVKK